jgi:hypothetical protein
VVEFGRKLAEVHRAVRDPLLHAQIRHLHSDARGGKSLFPTVEAMYAALGDTAVMLCFPRSMTHPEIAGNVETLTQRYLEAIGSGCLAVGRSPRELVDLFGFDPVVALDMRDPADHLLRILRARGDFQAHVERARSRLLEVGTFDRRARDILDVVIRSRGACH